MCRRLVWVLSIGGLVGGLVAGSSQSEAGPVPRGAFVAKPAELLVAARAEPGSAILRQDDRVEFDASGALVWTRHRIISLASEETRDAWQTLSLGWHPALEEVPQLRARIITPQGTVEKVDAAKLDEAAETTKDGQVSDSRIGSARLPAMEVGSVVEYELISRDLPFAGKLGITKLIAVGHQLPVLASHIHISAPTALGLQIRLRGNAVDAKPRIGGGALMTWDLELGRVAPLVQEGLRIPDDELVPYVGVATGRSWEAVGKAVREQVEERLAAGPVPVPREGRSGTGEDRLTRLTAWLHRTVRNTGIEAHQAAPLPAPPAQTVQRGRGSALDKAALLIALLRQIKFNAELGFVSVGPGLDTDVELPGMGVFDHVLVRVQFGAHTFWIDPVEELLPPGQLPSRSQGRRVLVLTDRGGELTKTPLSVSTDNVGHELRVFEMPDMGPARVTEVGGEGGAFSGAMRAQYRDTVQAELRAHMEKYVRGEYRNAKLGKLEFTDPTDLARPMRLTLVAEGSGSAYANFTELQWYLHPGDVLDKVPDMLRQEDEAAPRQTPMMWHTPHVYEIENRITVPQGFDIPATPTDSVQQLGTTTLITRRKQQGRTLSITFRFDSGKPLLTAEEFRSTRKAILAVRYSDGLTVNFPMAAMQKVEEGQHHAAVRELKALTEKFPRSGGHLSRLAVAYLEAGMQPAALRTAQRAVELAPQESLTYVVLARVLLRDELGRRTGASNAAAIAAYRRAISLDLEDPGYQRGLAEVLSLDSDGWLSDQPGALRAAAELFASAHKLNDTQGSAEQEALLLLRLGEMAEVERKLRARPASEMRDYVLLAAVAAQRGAAAALKEAEELAQTDEERGKILDSAGRELGVVGRYALSRELRVAAVAADSSLAGMLPDEPLVHRDLPARNDPRSAVMQFVRAVATGHEPATPPWGAAMTRELARHVHHLKPSIDRSTLTREVAVDWVQGSYKNQVSEVSPGQWRVAASNPWRPEIFYVVLEAQEAKILGTARVPHALGRHVAALLAKKQLSPARRWLDQVLDDLDEDNADRNLGARLALFWGPSLPRTNDQAELAAAVLMVGGDDEQALAPLTRCTGAKRSDCDLVLRAALANLGRWTEAEVVARRRSVADPVNEDAAVHLALALQNLGKYADALTVTAKLSNSEYHSDALLLAGRNQEAERILVERSRSGHPWDQNSLAWFRLGQNKDLPEALAMATVATSTYPSAAGINTRAALEAALGKDTAMESCIAAISARQDGAITSSDWYVIGRIAESYGLTEDAAVAYRKVTPELPGGPQSEYVMAQQRLGALAPGARPSRGTRRPRK